ncbi:ABC transporter permease [Lactobacillus sp. ESL0731]|uniref:ABC transporter permease n=1 Tax=unclassified Lactobacillus TaxID=2620435 RepID=UPI0023FA0F5E|nr:MULTISPECIES: ABC transporter permease [unclassified Lactobacillus]WEV51580.1 ABC transporter permease [Lactobacillus sp. ESL0700]WEV62709.1 ABC transporter permease [Lactobacillus sp. ESL0731]
MINENDEFTFAKKHKVIDHYTGKSYSFGQLVWHRFLKNKGAVVSVIVLIIIALIAFLAPHLSRFSPNTPYPSQSNLAPGMAGHWFGTDNLGRDIFVRVAAGTSVSLEVALVAMMIDLVIGTSYGLISGYFGGKVDLFMQRITEILSTIPMIIIVTLLVLVMKPGLISIIMAMMMVGWINMSRIVRAQVLELKSSEYVLSARTMGESNLKIIFSQILPNALGQIITTFMLSIPNAIFLEAFLAFIGLGVPAPLASLGTMINDGYSQAIVYPYMVIFPVLFLALIMLSFNIIADGLRDAIEGN